MMSVWGKGVMLMVWMCLCVISRCLPGVRIVTEHISMHCTRMTHDMEQFCTLQCTGSCCILSENKYNNTVAAACRKSNSENICEKVVTGMQANAQHDGRPAEYRWHPLLNAAKFGWCLLLDGQTSAKFCWPLLNDVSALRKLRCETCWNCWGAPNAPRDLSH